MRNILFVCHGNICRSPMAEFILKDMVKKAGREGEFHIESMATSSEELGNDMYPPAKRKLKEKGVPFSYRQARRVKEADYDRFDEIYVMDRNNLRNIKWNIKADPEHKIEKLLDRDVADPWYTGNFEATYKDLVEGCKKILEK